MEDVREPYSEDLKEGEEGTIVVHVTFDDKDPTDPTGQKRRQTLAEFLAGTNVPHNKIWIGAKTQETPPEEEKGTAILEMVELADCLVHLRKIK